MQFSGAPAATAASLITIAAAFELSCALGWNAKIMGFLVFRQISDLKITVDVGFVTGVIPAITPTGSAISVIPVTGSSEMTPTVFRCLMLFTTYSQAKRFFVALSSKTPLFVSSIASLASTPWLSKPATEHFATI